MTFDPSEPDTLTGKLLLASPQLQEPTFRRTVVLMTNHGAEDGALGYILNRPARQKVGELLASSEFSELASVPVFMGGPVGTEHLTFTSLAWNHASGKLQFQTHLATQEAIRNLKEGFCVRAFVGYSGWSEGQLENELREKAWELAAPVQELLQLEKMNADLWAELIREVSPSHRLAADMPDDPTVN